MQGFAAALEKGLLFHGIEVRHIASKMRLARWKWVRGGIKKWLGYVDKYVLFLPEMKRAAAWADIVHVCDQGNGMYLPFLPSVPHLVTCHDMLAIRAAQGEFPLWPTGAAGKIYQRLILSGLNRSQHMACVSEATRQDALRLTSLPPEALRVIPNGLYQDFSPMTESESEPLLATLGLAKDQRFLLHVGGDQPYKNRPMTLEIFHELQANGVEDIALVLAGRPLSAEMLTTIQRLELTDRVVECSNPTHFQLRALYSRAEGLLFPSLEEGFGLPILEAQASGCPVFTSNRSPMTEVGGSAAVYFDPLQPIEAARIIARSLPIREDLKIAGRENARNYTYDRMISSYLAAYEAILSGSF